MSEWYDSAVGTAYLAMVMLMGFGSLWLPCAWWWGFNDSVSLRLRAFSKKWSSMMFSFGNEEVEKAEFKLVFLSLYIASPIWATLWLFVRNPDSWGPFFGGREACIGYLLYIMFLSLLCWAFSPGGLMMLISVVITLYTFLGAALDFARFLWVGNKVLWKAIMKCKTSIRPYSIAIFFIAVLALWAGLVKWVIPIYFPEGLWCFFSSYVSSGQVFLILLVSMVVLFGVSSLITYRLSPPDTKALFFFKTRGAEVLSGLTVKAGKMLWSKVSFIFESDSWFLGGVVSKVLRSSTDRQKKWALVLLLAVVIVSVGVGAGSYWAVSSGMALEQLWEAVMSDLFFG